MMKTILHSLVSFLPRANPPATRGLWPVLRLGRWTLTEFPDPVGKATYFRLRDYAVAVDDELLAGRAR
jgi:hypothetical protein